MHTVTWLVIIEEIWIIVCLYFVFSFSLSSGGEKIFAGKLTHHCENVGNVSVLDMYRIVLVRNKPEAMVRRCSLKKVLLKISQNSQETPVLESLFNKFADLYAYNCIKRDSSTGLFLLILGNFWEHLFCRTPPVAASNKLLRVGVLQKSCFERFHKTFRKTLMVVFLFSNVTVATLLERTSARVFYQVLQKRCL